jgi:Protein of unknown function (DUF3810)
MDAIVLGRVLAFTGSLKALWQGLWVPLCVLGTGVLAQSISGFTPRLTERFYTSAVYPLILSALTFFSRHFSFSVGETSISFLLLAAIACLGRFCYLLVSRPFARPQLGRAASKILVWLAAILLWLFLLAFGFNYQRPHLYELLGYEQRQANVLELESLGEEIVRGVNDNYLEAHAEGRMMPGGGEILNLLKESYDTTAEVSLLPRGDFTPPKPSYFSGLLTRLGIGGFYFPFTGEPHFNADAPDFQLPFSAAHEMAHQRGVARESEANFVAYLVCVNSRDPFVRYSGYRNGLGVLSELAKLEPERAKSLAKRLGPGYAEDSRRAAIFWAKAAGAAGALSRRINDLYLRANRVKSGVEDYRGSTALIIGRHLHQLSKGKSPTQVNGEAQR